MRDSARWPGWPSVGESVRPEVQPSVLLLSPRARCRPLWCAAGLASRRQSCFMSHRRAASSVAVRWRSDEHRLACPPRWMLLGGFGHGELNTSSPDCSRVYLFRANTTRRRANPVVIVWHALLEGLEDDGYRRAAAASLRKQAREHPSLVQVASTSGARRFLQPTAHRKPAFYHLRLPGIVLASSRAPIAATRSSSVSRADASIRPARPGLRRNRPFVRVGDARCDQQLASLAETPKKWPNSASAPDSHQALRQPRRARGLQRHGRPLAGELSLRHAGASSYTE